MFNFLPWLFLFFVPAVAMRLWAEERKSGSIELLFTQPVTVWQAVLGKFLAAWAFVGIALALTFPTWLTVNYLGNPDNGAIFAGYIGALVMAGGFLAVGSCMSALTSNQVIAFVLAFVVCAVFVLAGFTAVTDWSRAIFSGIASWGFWGDGMSAGIESIGAALTNGIAGLSFLTHFENLMKGVLDLRDLLFFALVIVFFLLASTALLDTRKSK
jgi:ABC-2 type transport system permease protein